MEFNSGFKGLINISYHIISLPAGITADKLLGPCFLPLRLTGTIYRDFLRNVLPELLQDMDPQTGILYGSCIMAIYHIF